MGMRSWLLGLGIVSSVVLAGCGDDSPEAINTDNTDDTENTEEGSSASLDGRTFLSTSVSEGGEDRPLVDGTRIELRFSDGRISATAGCNTLGGQVDMTPDRIVIDEMASTAMGCDDARHGQEEWLSRVLYDDPGYTLDGQTLRLVRGDTTIELVDREAAEPDLPLEGTRWALDGIIDGEVASSVPAGAGATLTLTNGAASIAIDGCNQGSADVTITETAIELGDLAMTRMACSEPAASVEATVVGVLDGEITYTIESDTLTLTHPSGQGLTFHAAE
jgi:heat shock protein HslJ